MSLKSNVLFQNKIMAVLFDFDNTLLPTDQLRQQLSERVLVEMKVENLVAGCCRFLIGITEEEGNDIIRDRFKIDPLKFRQRRNFLENKALESGIIKPYPYVLETLGYVNKINIPWGIVTQSNRERIIDFIIGRKIFGETKIDLIVGSDEIEARGKKNKPHPDPYLIAAERLKIPPEKCMAVEDSDSGVQAALAANMQTVWYNNQFHSLKLELQAKVNFVVDSFKDLLDILKNRFGEVPMLPEI